MKMKFIKKYFSKKDKTFYVNSKEEDYYKRLFIENEYWNKAEPNHEEEIRWEIIENFILHFLHLKNNLNCKLKILDLGCGRGWLTNLLSKYGNVIGVEPIGSVVKYANKLFPDLNIIKGTAKELLDKNFGKFDLIVSSEVIEHIADKEKNDFVINIKKLLKKDGFVIITTPRKDAEEEWKKYISPSQPIEDWMSEDMVHTLFSENGFLKILLDRFSIPPSEKAPLIEIYQLWLFQNI
jgi:2-polyprenyl-3-methyl-5-hydroxy-6-metoxy-1,4-benzoquinol methylase